MSPKSPTQASNCLGNLWGVSWPSQARVAPPAVACATHRVVESIVIHVKVGGVHGPPKLGDVRGSAVCQALPVHALEEGVVPEVIQPSAAQPLLLAAQQPADQVLGTGWHIRHV